MSPQNPMRLAEDGDDDGPYRFQCSLLQGLMHVPARVLASNQVYDRDAINAYLWAQIASGKTPMDPNTRIPISPESILRGDHLEQLPNLKAEIDQYCLAHNKPLPQPYRCNITILGDLVCGEDAVVRHIGYSLLLERAQQGLSWQDAKDVCTRLWQRYNHSADIPFVRQTLFVLFSTYALLGGTVPGFKPKNIAEAAAYLAQEGMIGSIVMNLGGSYNPVLQAAAAEAVVALAHTHYEQLLNAQVVAALVQQLQLPTTSSRLQGALVRAVYSLAWQQSGPRAKAFVDALQVWTLGLLNGAVECDQLAAIRVLRALSFDPVSGQVNQQVIDSLNVLSGMVAVLRGSAASVQSAALAFLQQLVQQSPATHLPLIQAGFLQGLWFVADASPAVRLAASRVLRCVCQQRMQPEMVKAVASHLPALLIRTSMYTTPGLQILVRHATEGLASALSRMGDSSPVCAPATAPVSTPLSQHQQHSCSSSPGSPSASAGSVAGMLSSARRAAQ